MRYLPTLLIALALALPAPAAAEPFSFLVESTDQLGVPGHAPGTEVTPEGNLYTGQGELTFRFGRSGRAWDQPLRTLHAGRYPVISGSRTAGGVRYELTVFASELGGSPVNFARVEMRNVSRRTARARWIAGWRHTGGEPKGSDGLRRFRFRRPAIPAREGLYFQPGNEFDPDARYRFAGTTLLRDGLALYRGPRARRGLAISRRARPTRGRARPGTIFGTSDHRLRLRPGQSARLDFVSPLTGAHVRGVDYDDELRKTLARWRSLLGPALDLHIPEEKVEDAFYASLANILMARYRSPTGAWVQAVNKLQYHAFWLRDAAVMGQALDLAGLHRPAGENLPFFLSWQQPDGLFLSRPGQMDGFGQALWAFGEHVRRARDLELGRMLLPAVERAMAWFDAARRTDPLGLVPPGDPGDNELVAGHLAGDQFWAAAGVEQAVALARTLGREDLAARWQSSLDEFRAALERALRAAVERSDGVIPPSLDTAGGRDWGNLWAAYPARVLAPRDPRVAATLRRARGDFAEGIATYGRNLHHYLGFRVWQTDLLRGDDELALRGLYDSLAHTTATHGGFETGVRIYGSRATDDNMAPHGWFAAEYVALLRNMLVREDGAGLVLMSAVSPGWLRPGRHLGVSGAPTLHGRVTFDLEAGRRGAMLSWRADVPAGTPIRWPLPAAVKDASAPGLDARSRTITLPATRGRLEVRWTLDAAGTPGYDSAVRRLRSAYERRGR